MGRGSWSGGGSDPLLPSKSPAAAAAAAAAAALSRCRSRPDDDLAAFRSCLRWMCVDQSGTWRALLSWSLFILLSVGVPLLSHFVLLYSDHRRPYDAVVQLSLTAAAAISFACLSASYRKYGLRRFLFLDKISAESKRVQRGYVLELSRSLRILSLFVMPCFVAECGYKIWWYLAGARRIPFLGNEVASDVAACALELASWMYRTAIFFLVCVLFRLICHLQILRLHDFTAVFHEESEVAAVLGDHLRIRRQLMVISHRFRRFILAGLALVTASQFAALLLTTRPHSDVHLFNTGELALCSVVLVTGLLICLRSAVKITHKAQAITKHAAKWHACATIESVSPDPEAPSEGGAVAESVGDDEGCDEEEADGDEEFEDTEIVTPHANTISFQKRQALVTYLENNAAGITVFGFVLDRNHLQMIFMGELSLFLWLLGKTVGIS